MNSLVVIPARGGSKGIPRKNIRFLGGKPLIQWTIDEVKKVFPDNEICVSTDDVEIKNIVEQNGLKVPFLRPKKLATDTSGTYEVLLHTLSFYEDQGYNPDIMILLQPTSPFRTAEQIKEALEIYTPDIEMIISVKETKSNPYYVLREENENGFLNSLKESKANRRQDIPKVWEINGAIYIINVKALKQKPLSQFTRVKKYVMDEISSLDLDTILDWKVAEALVLLENRNQ